MKYYIAATMVISAIVFWIIFFIILIYGYILKKRNPEWNKYGVNPEFCVNVKKCNRK